MTVSILLFFAIFVALVSVTAYRERRRVRAIQAGDAATKRLRWTAATETERQAIRDKHSQEIKRAIIATKRQKQQKTERINNFFVWTTIGGIGILFFGVVFFLIGNLFAAVGPVVGMLILIYCAIIWK